MKTSDFDFELPDERIAQTPLAERDGSRLLVLPRANGAPVHSTFRDLGQWLQPGDLLVLNDAKVIPARLRGAKDGSGGKVELLLCDPLPPLGDRAVWRCMGGSSKPLRVGQGIRLRAPGAHEEGELRASAPVLHPTPDVSGAGGGLSSRGERALQAEVVAVGEGGFVDVAFDEAPDTFLDRVEELGELPLPPYMRRGADDTDRTRYQTIFAASRGAVAAPTAGLHFTDAVFASLRARGVETTTVTLHVGPGTFLPVRAEQLDDHRMHAERYEVPLTAAEAIAKTRAAGGRVIAVGTTALRTLESAAQSAAAGRDHEAVAHAAASGAGTLPDGRSFAPRAGGIVPAGTGVSELFVRPGYTFRAVDGLLTNFHLPRSTLVMLVAALTGRERLLSAYAEAVERGYRFYSYGDAMLVL